MHKSIFWNIKLRFAILDAHSTYIVKSCILFIYWNTEKLYNSYRTSDETNFGHNKESACSSNQNITVMYYRFRANTSAGCLACTYNPASGRLGRVDGLSLGALFRDTACWSGARTKLDISMDLLEESSRCRLAKEERSGSGGKPSSQKFPCSAVVGSCQWVGVMQQPQRNSQTSIFFFVKTTELKQTCDLLNMLSSIRVPAIPTSTNT